jgi:hypothetical protein
MIIEESVGNMRIKMFEISIQRVRIFRNVRLIEFTQTKLKESEHMI